MTGLAELDRALAASGRRARVDVLGHADSDGPDDLNANLSLARANEVLARLQRGTFARLEFAARGLGRAPVSPGATEAEHERNRRAGFDVQVLEDAMRSARP
jgi:outer membrane protein OmpA-like peptidoglycan-associated protein